MYGIAKAFQTALPHLRSWKLVLGQGNFEILSDETTGTSTNWNCACGATMEKRWAAWIRRWIGARSLWKPVRRLKIQTQDSEQIVLPLAKPVSEKPLKTPTPTPTRCLLLQFQKPGHTTCRLLHRRPTLPVLSGSRLLAFTCESRLFKLGRHFRAEVLMSSNGWVNKQ